MPVKSAAQYKFMQAIAHGKGMKSVGPSKMVAKEFVKETKPEKRSLFMRKK